MSAIPQSSPQKEAVQAFLRQVTSGDIRNAYGTYIHPEFKHHNVWYKGDRETLMKGMEENHVKFPAKKFDIKKILEEGDMVVTFSSISLTGMSEMSVMHMFRFEGGKIKEMWDCGQEIPKDMPNANGPF